MFPNFFFISFLQRNHIILTKSLTKEGNTQEIPKKENKSCHKTLTLPHVARYGQLTPLEYEKGNICQLMFIFSSQVDLASKFFPKTPAKQKKLALGETNTFQTTLIGKGTNLLSSRIRGHKGETFALCHQPNHLILSFLFITLS